VPTAGPFSDALIGASVRARIDTQSEPVLLELLRQSCDSGQSLCCALLLRRLDSGDEKTKRYAALKAKRMDLGRFAWATLVFESDGDERRLLAREALIKFPSTDLFYSAADYVPQRDVGLQTYINNPSYMTLLALGVGLIRSDEWALLENAMQLAQYSGLPDIIESEDYWLLRSRVAARLKRLDLSWAYAATAALVTAKGRNKKSHLLSIARLAARHEDSVDLLPVLLELPAAQNIKGDQDLLLAGMRLHRARVQRRAQILTARPRDGRVADPFSGGLLAALVASRFESKVQRRRALLAEAVLAAPDNLQAWVRLSVAEDELKHIPEAIGALRNALRVDADEPESLNNLAYMLALHRPKEHLEAELMARRSLLLRPRPATLDTLAEIRFRRGDRVGALRLIRLAKELDPKSSFYGRQEARFNTGNRDAPVPSEEP
jgi:tetratricopeptide (TPR) repeat protein